MEKEAKADKMNTTEQYLPGYLLEYKYICATVKLQELKELLRGF